MDHEQLTNQPAELQPDKETGADPADVIESVEAAEAPEENKRAGAEMDALLDSEAGDLPEDPVKAPPDGSRAESGKEAADSDTAALREEIAQLKKELRERQSAMERMGRECEEFRTLYPEVPLSSLPDEVWENVRQGVPVAAAFALSERRKYCLLQTANSSNRANAMRSTGALEQDKNGYFSPDEVRAMSPAEVRRNYQNILNSMQKWR